MALTDDKGGKAAKPPSPVPEKRGGWLSRIAPGIRQLVAKRDTPDNLWVKDPDSGEMVFRPDLEKALWVMPGGRHMRIGPGQRFAYSFDDGKFEKIVTPPTVDDPLKFSDIKPYPELLAASRKATGEIDAMTVAVGKICGVETVVAVQNFAFRGGTLSIAVGEAFIAAAQEAVRRQCPLVVFTASGGARMQEGTLALMQMARATLAVQLVKNEHLPYVVVLTDPTTGGVLASYAMLGDVHLAEPDALIGFAGRRVIEETIRETLPAGFQTAEFLVERGAVDRVVPRGEMRTTLGSILATLLMGRALRSAA